MPEIQARLFVEPIALIVRRGTGSISYREDGPAFTDEHTVISRVPREHNGWRSVKYRGLRYQLFGGIRTPHFICLNSPIGPGRD